MIKQIKSDRLIEKRSQRKRVFLLLATIFFVSTVWINGYLLLGTRDRIVTQVDRLPKRQVGVVLGTDLMRADGSTNIHFLHRVEGATRAYFSGRVARLVISGNPNNKGYNEVVGIKCELLKSGVPERDIMLDFGGVRTIDSIRRIHDLYYLENMTIITDDFHAPRALFLSRSFGLDTVAFCYGSEPVGYWYLRSRLREYFARIKAVLDVACLKVSQ